MDYLTLIRLANAIIATVTVPYATKLAHKVFLEWRLLKSTKYRPMSLALVLLFSFVWLMTIAKAIMFWILLLSGGIARELLNMRLLFENFYLLAMVVLFLRLGGKINDN